MSVTQATEMCVNALRTSPAGLFTDIDGTISHISETPDQSELVDEARGALTGIADEVEIVAIVTGRSARNAATLVGIPELTVIGNHGLERIHDGQRTFDSRAQRSMETITTTLDYVRSEMAGETFADDLIFEDKELTGSIHYRRAGDVEEARRALLTAIERAPGSTDLKITQGRLVIELRPRIDIDKGKAVERVATELSLRGMVFLGDDVTDVDAFHTLRSLAASGARTVAVGIVSEESNPIVAETADVTVPGVDAAVELLTNVQAELSRGNS